MDLSPSGWLLPLLATVLFYGLAQALTKQFMANLSAGAFIVLYVILKVLINGGVVLGWAHQPFWGGTASTFMTWALAANALIASAWVFYYLALESGKVSLVGTLTAVYPAVTVVLAGIFIGGAERLVPLQYAGIALVIAAAGLMGYQRDESAPDGSRKWLWFSLAVILLWGVGLYYAKVAYGVDPAAMPGWDANYLVANAICVFVILLPYGLWSTRGKLGAARDLLPALLPTALFVLGDVTLFRAVNTGPASIVTPLSGLYPVITLLYVVPVLKERLAATQKAALATTFVAILLVLSSSWLPDFQKAITWR
jgi:transporter family protein